MSGEFNHRSPVNFSLSAISRRTRLAALAAVVTVAVAAGVGVAAVNKTLTLNIDGRSTTVRAFSGTVGEVLASQDIDLGQHDLVAPSTGSAVHDGDTIVVRYGRKLTVTLDGAVKEYWTTATTVAAALAELGLRASGAELSASRSQTLGRDGLELSMTTPKKVSVRVDGKTRSLDSTAITVKELLADLEITTATTDRVSPGAGTAVTAGLKVTVKRVKSRTVTRTESIAFDTVRKNDASIYEGQSTTLTAGVAGRRTLTVSQVVVDGKVESQKTVKTVVTAQPKSALVAVGTKHRPSPPPISAGTTSGAGINLANSGMWDRIAQCESGGNWSINTGNGYYGGLQFATASWLGMGGGDFAPRADLASRAEQITVANRYYARSGLSPWGCAHAA